MCIRINSPILKRCILIASACHTLLNLGKVVLLTPVLDAKSILLGPENRGAIRITQLRTKHVTKVYEKTNKIIKLSISLTD